MANFFHSGALQNLPELVFWFHSVALQNLPKLVFWSENLSSGNPAQKTSSLASPENVDSVAAASLFILELFEF
jgi:hypothetical protein